MEKSSEGGEKGGFCLLCCEEIGLNILQVCPKAFPQPLFSSSFLLNFWKSLWWLTSAPVYLFIFFLGDQDMELLKKKAFFFFFSALYIKKYI